MKVLLSPSSHPAHSFDDNWLIRFLAEKVHTAIIKDAPELYFEGHLLKRCGLVLNALALT